MVDRKWMKELGIEVVKSIRAYETYEVPDTALLNLIRIVNRTFALGFTQEELENKGVNFSLFAEEIIPEIEKRLVLDAFNLWNNLLFKWEKPEGQPVRYFRIEEIRKELLYEPIKIKEIEEGFKEQLPQLTEFKNSRIIFQERWPWEIRQRFDEIDKYTLKARLAAQIIPKEAKLVMED